MNGYLKQSTASQTRLIGPFIDDTDFKTASTGLTVANTDVKLRANGTTLSNKNSGGGTHQVNGMYSLTWDATDTANVGELFYSVKVAGALQVFGSYVVLEEAVYDALFGASALGYVANAPVNVAQWNGSNVASPHTAGYPVVTIKDGTGTGEIDTTSGGVLVAALAANAITASALATSAVDEIVDATWDEINTGATHNIANSTGRQLRAAQGGTVVTIRSGTLQSGSTSNTAKLDAGASATNNIYNGNLLVLTGGTGAGQTRTIISYNGTTKVATVDSNWVTTPDNTTTFDIIANANSAILDEGLIVSATGTTAVLASTASASDNIYTTAFLAIVSGTGAGQTREITAYVGATKTATVAAWSVTPDATSGYVVVPNGSLSAPGGPSAAQIATAVYNMGVSVIGPDAITSSALATSAVAEIADGVWDEPLAGHLTAGTTGEALSNAGGSGTPPTAAAIADAVWDETLADHLSVGSTGEALDAAGGTSSLTAEEIADAVLNRDFSLVTDSNDRTLLNAARLSRNKWTIVGTTLTVYKEDDATIAWTAELTQNPSGRPVSSVDPG